MSKFLLQLSWTEQGIKDIKNFPKRAQAARDAGKKMGVEIEQVYVTTGESDLLLIVESATGDNVAKYAVSLASQGQCPHAHVAGLDRGRIRQNAVRLAIAPCALRLRRRCCCLRLPPRRRSTSP